MLQVATSADAPRRSWRAPDAHALIAMEVLGLDKLKPRARLKAKRVLHYHWFAGRYRALSQVGIVAEAHGTIAARMCADTVLARLNAGINLTTADAAYVVREASHRLADLRDVNGGQT